MNRSTAIRIRHERAGRYDEDKLFAARFTAWVLGSAFGIFAVVGLTGISGGACGIVPSSCGIGFDMVGGAYLLASALCVGGFLLNEPRLRLQERKHQAMLDRQRLDSVLARAVAAALAEGDERTMAEAA